jgi:hypothetical protein
MSQGQEKWLFLYFLRRLEQNQLTRQEIAFMSKDFVVFLRLWQENAETVSTLKVDDRLLWLLKQDHRQLYSQEIEGHIMDAGLQLASRYMKESPAFLPSFLLVMHKMTEVCSEDEHAESSSLFAGAEATRLAQLFLDIDKKDILKYIAFICPYVDKEIFLRVPVLLKKSISPLLIGAFTEQDKEAVSTLVNTMISVGYEEEVLKIKDTLSLILDIDFASIIAQRPELMGYLKEHEIDNLFFRCIEERSTQNAEMLFGLFPKRCRELWADMACTGRVLQKGLVDILAKSVLIKEHLLLDTAWIEVIEGTSQDLAVQYFLKSRHPELKEQAASFLDALHKERRPCHIVRDQHG